MKCFQNVHASACVVIGSLLFVLACGSRQTDSATESQLSSASTLSSTVAASCQGSPTFVSGSDGQITVTFSPELSINSAGAPTVRKRCTILLPYSRKNGQAAQVSVTPNGFFQGVGQDLFFYSARMSIPGSSYAIADVTINQSQNVYQKISIVEPADSVQRFPQYSGMLEIQFSMTLRSSTGGSASAGMKQLNISVR